MDYLLLKEEEEFGPLEDGDCLYIGSQTLQIFKSNDGFKLKIVGNRDYPNLSIPPYDLKYNNTEKITIGKQ